MTLLLVTHFCFSITPICLEIESENLAKTVGKPKPSKSFHCYYINILVNNQVETAQSD